MKVSQGHTGDAVKGSFSVATEKNELVTHPMGVHLELNTELKSHLGKGRVLRLLSWGLELANEGEVRRNCI